LTDIDLKKNKFLEKISAIDKYESVKK